MTERKAAFDNRMRTDPRTERPTRVSETRTDWFREAWNNASGKEKAALIFTAGSVLAGSCFGSVYLFRGAADQPSEETPQPTDLGPFTPQDQVESTQPETAPSPASEENVWLCQIVNSPKWKSFDPELPINETAGEIVGELLEDNLPVSSRFLHVDNDGGRHPVNSLDELDITMSGKHIFNGELVCIDTKLQNSPESVIPGSQNGYVSNSEVRHNAQVTEEKSKNIPRN